MIDPLAGILLDTSHPLFTLARATMRALAATADFAFATPVAGEI